MIFFKLLTLSKNRDEDYNTGCFGEATLSPKEIGNGSNKNV